MKLSTICMAALSMVFTIISTSSPSSALDTSCVSQLLPCLMYLNESRDPPESCCNPLKSVLNDIPDCLCSFISIKGSRQAEQLPGRCGQHVNPIACLTGSTGSGNLGESSGAAAALASCLMMLSSLTLVTIGNQLV